MLAQVIIFAAFLAALGLQWRAGKGDPVAAVVILFFGYLLVRVIHELGHAACCVVLGVKIRSISIALLPGSVRFRIGEVILSLGYRGGSRVTRDAVPSPGRAMVIAAAGPGATLLAAVAALAVGKAVSTSSDQRLAYGLAVICAADVVANLIPCRTRRGTFSDGASIYRGPAKARADADVARLIADPDWIKREDALRRLLAADRLDVPAAWSRLPAIVMLLRKDGRIDDLLKLHERAPVPALPVARNGASPTTKKLASYFNALEWVVLTIPGLPAHAADLAAERMEWALRQYTEHDESWLAMEHTLALARLRQKRFAEVEPLSRPALGADLDPPNRAAVLATIVMARHALGHPFRELLDEALALSPNADLVQEAVSLVSGKPPSASRSAG